MSKLTINYKFAKKIDLYRLNIYFDERVKYLGLFFFVKTRYNKITKILYSYEGVRPKCHHILSLCSRILYFVETKNDPLLEA